MATLNDTTAIATGTVAATQAAETAPAVKTVLTDLAPKSPYFFDTVDDAFNFLAARLDPDSKEYLADFNQHPKLFAGMSEDADGNTVFAEQVFTPDARIMFHVLTNRGKKIKDAQGNETESPKTVRALVLHPVPTNAAIENDEAGRKWLDRIINTQIVHTTVAALRKTDDLAKAAIDMPGIQTIGDGDAQYEAFDLASFFTGRETGGAFESFDDTYKAILDAFNSKSPAWKRARLNKAELKKCFESKAYALSTNSPLEDRGDKPSMFVMALEASKKLAAKNGASTDIFDEWLSTRDDKTGPAADETEEDFDIDDLELLAATDATTETTEDGTTQA